MNLQNISKWSPGFIHGKQNMGIVHASCAILFLDVSLLKTFSGESTSQGTLLFLLTLTLTCRNVNLLPVYDVTISFDKNTMCPRIPVFLDVSVSCTLQQYLSLSLFRWGCSYRSYIKKEAYRTGCTHTDRVKSITAGLTIFIHVLWIIGFKITRFYEFWLKICATSTR